MPKPLNKPELSKQGISANEERYRAMVMATSDVIYGMSADWEIMYELDGRGFVSDTSEPSTDWMSLNVFPDDHEKVKLTIAEAIRSKSIFQLEHRVIRPDKTVGWTLSRAVPIFDEQGEIIEWFGAASDISDRKAAEEALLQATQETERHKRMLEAVTSGTPDLIYMFDLNYHFTYANKALLEMWGKTWDEAIGKGLLENGYEPWHAQMHQREIDHVKETKQAIRGEVSFPHATLGKRVYDYIFTPVLNGEGEVEAVAGTTRDVTDRKNWEDALSQSSEELHEVNEAIAASNEEHAASNEELRTANKELAFVNQQLVEAQHEIEERDVALRLAVEAANFGTWYINSVTREFITDARLKELFGYHPDESLTIEQAINQINEEYRADVSEKLENALTNNGAYDVSYPVTGLHNQKERWLRAIGNLKADPSGSFSAFTGVVMDITEKKAEEQMKNDFIGMVSHELKTPLTSLKAIIQVSNLKLKDSEDQFLSGAMAKANVQVKRMTRMISGFLNISRLESGKMLIEKKYFNLEALIREIVEEMRLSVPNYTINFESGYPGEVYGDDDKINSVITNLIGNGVKYSEPGSEVLVSSAATDSEIIISVRDRGIGINSSDAARIFDRYYRVESSRTLHISGFGIGLYLCSEIVKRHEGRIWLESEKGVGSTFYFSLPR